MRERKRECVCVCVSCCLRTASNLTNSICKKQMKLWKMPFNLFTYVVSTWAVLMSD